MKNESVKTQKHYPRLKKFTFKNWKSFKEGVLYLDDLTVLTGRNGAGKTNVMEAMEFAIRAICLERTRYAKYDRDISYWVRAYQDQHLRLQNILLDNEIGFVEFEFIVEANETTDYVYKFRLYPKKPCDKAIKKELAYISTEANEWEIKRVGNKFGAQIIERAVKEAIKWFIRYEVAPNKVDRYFAPCKELERDFSNLSSWFAVRLEILPFNKINELTKFVLDLPSIDFLFVERIPKNEAKKAILESVYLELKLQETIGGVAKLLDWSDGMIAVFCMLTAVLTAQPGAVIAFENIDAFIHPSCVKRLIEIIEKEAKERQFTILLTTHSVALLDALPLRMTKFVQVVYRNPETDCSEINSIGDLDEFTRLVGAGSLGRNCARGKLEQVFCFESTTEYKNTNGK